MSEAMPKTEFTRAPAAPAVRVKGSTGPGEDGVGPVLARYFLDMGWWRAPGGRRQLLTWEARTGALFMGEIILAVIPDEIEMRRRLDGWAEHAGTPEGTGWLAQRLEGCR